MTQKAYKNPAQNKRIAVFLLRHGVVELLAKTLLNSRDGLRSRSANQPDPPV